MKALSAPKVFISNKFPNIADASGKAPYVEIHRLKGVGGLEKTEKETEDTKRIGLTD